MQQRQDFSLFQTPLDLAHKFWREIVIPGDSLIDATAGNGKDALFLARLLKGSGTLKVYDIQEKALHNTKLLLEKNLSKHELSIVEFLLQSHTRFQDEKVKLIVYNLGYLPGGDKSITTQSNTSLESVRNGIEKIIDGGMISITCYPGHDEGKKEEEALLQLTQTLSATEWSVSYHRWINRSLSPSLLLLQKKRK